MNLLFSRKFFPLFWAQFFGSFNDNFLKYAFIIIVTIKAASVFSIPFEQVVSLTATVFIIPYFFFSIIAGQFADKFSKAKLLKIIKFTEIIVMTIAAYAFINNNLEILFIVIFLMGAQTTFFGPVRYGLIPIITGEKKLILGNALVQVSRLTSTLLGTILAGLFVVASNEGELILAVFVIISSILGFINSLFQLPISSKDPDLKISLNIFKTFLEAIRVSKKDRLVFSSIVGISWFWFYSVSVLSIIPIYVKEILRADKMVLTLFLVIFIVTVSIGCFVCNYFSKDGKSSPKLLPISIAGIVIFTADVFFQGNFSVLTAKAGTLKISELLQYPFFIRVTVDLAFMALFSGMFSLPLFAAIQQRASKKYLSRIIAANDLLNAFFIVASGGLLYLLFEYNYSCVVVFGIMAAGSIVQGAWMILYPRKFSLKF